MSDRRDPSDPEEIFHNQLLTPASTPAPIQSPSDLESDSDSLDSDQSIHTAIAHEQIQVLNMSHSHEEFGTPAQRHAAYVTSLLHKTPIKPTLTSSNYAAWSDSVRFGLSAASYDMFLTSEEIEGTGLDNERHIATKKCVFHWLLANMGTT